MILHQIRSTDGTGTLSYLVIDEESRAAAVIDPNLPDVPVILQSAKERNARITHVFDTHTHADHVTGAGEIRRHTGAAVIMHENTKDKWKVVDQGDSFGIGDILRKNASIEVDRYIRDRETIGVGGLVFTVLHTPGHTDNHISLLVEDVLFTGDLLLVGQAGRSDLPGGNTRDQYRSLFGTVLTLPESTRIYPGHDYEGNEFTTLRHEKATNPFLQPMTEEAYERLVADFFPPFADVGEGGKVTLQCGTRRVSTHPEGYVGITPRELAEIIQKDPSIFLLDVREPYELTAFGAIPGVRNISIREVAFRQDDLPKEKSVPLAVICQSGSRSTEVAHFLVQQGYKTVYNLNGGTSAWAMAGNPVERGMRQEKV